MATANPSKQYRVPDSPGRRRFLADAAGSAGGVLLFGLVLGAYSRQVGSLPVSAIRPPGALAEQQFLGACVRCGLCVRECPYDTLNLAGLGEPVVVGTPYFTARDVPCEMCEDIPCVNACPTGALNKSLIDIDDARMGLAVLSDRETCLAVQGLRCEVCFNVCPARGEAITLDLRHNERSGKHATFVPVVHSDACTGCGKCENACVLEEAAIKVFPVRLAKGELGQHYRWGWEEKEVAGGSLVTPDRPHEYNLPPGQRYDYEGEGLIVDEEAYATPFAGTPLDTLERAMEGRQ